MANPNILVTAGCSFSQVPNADTTWPVHLQKALSFNQVLYLGQGAAGNGIISRRVIYHVSQLLKINRPENILVGIMWSGRDRMEVYSKKEIPHHAIESGSAYRNPVPIANERNFYLLNNHWDDESTKTFFKYFYNDEYATILTLEHILRTQWYLKQNKVNYFMCQYHYACLPNPKLRGPDIHLLENEDISALYNNIDFSNWIYEPHRPFNNMWSYATETGLPFARPPDPHPATEHHQLFVRDHVLPFLVDKKFSSY